MKLSVAEFMEALERNRMAGISGQSVQRYEKETLPAVALVQSARNVRAIVAGLKPLPDFPPQPNVDPEAPLSNRLIDMWRVGHEVHANYTRLYRELNVAIAQIDKALQDAGFRAVP